MNAIDSTADTTTRQILEDLEAVRENLLALSDDIWRSIDHNDPQALDAGVEFKRQYNAKVLAFDEAATAISSLIQQYTRVRLEEAEESGGADRIANDRIVADLNRETPHELGEDFTYKRPHGFILDGQGTTGVTTWQRLYELTLRQLLTRDPARFREMFGHPEFTTNRGNCYFAAEPAELRKALAISDDAHAESNLSANAIRDMLRRVLAFFSIPEERMVVFLRQDRDAGRLNNGE